MPPKILAIPAVVFALTAALIVTLDRLLLGHVHRDGRTVWTEEPHGGVKVHYDPNMRPHDPYWDSGVRRDEDIAMASSGEMAALGL
jgi:hypothetical protein